MFESFKITDYPMVKPSQHDKDEIAYAVEHMDGHNAIRGSFIEASHRIAVEQYWLECLSKRMKFIDAQPKVTIIRMHRQRHSTRIVVGVYEAHKGFEGGPYYDNGNLTRQLPFELDREFPGKDKAKAFDSAIALVKAHPGSFFVVTGDLTICDIPKRAQPFSGYAASGYTFSNPKKKVK